MLSWTYHHLKKFRDLGIGQVIKRVPKFDNLTHQLDDIERWNKTTQLYLKNSNNDVNLTMPCTKQVVFPNDRKLCFNQIHTLGYSVVNVENAKASDIVDWLTPNQLPMNTIYETIFSVTDDNTKAINFSNTSKPLDFHQDLTYYEDPPYIQSLICRAPAETGGITCLKNVHDNAIVFQKEYPNEFDILSKYPTNFQKINYCRTNPVHIVKDIPIMEMRNNNLFRVNWSPFVEGFTKYKDKKSWEEYYEAYHTWKNFIDSCQEIHFELAKGEMLIFNNQRMLHGRTSFEGHRELEGFYLSTEQFKSELTKLGKNLIEDTNNGTYSVMVTKGGFSGLAATRDIEPGETIVTQVAKAMYETPDRFTIQRDSNVHLEISNDLKYSNHSFSPNSEIVFDDNTINWVGLKSTRFIKEGENIVWNYMTTETAGCLAEPFVDMATGRSVT